MLECENFFNMSQALRTPELTDKVTGLDLKRRRIQMKENESPLK
jgi:hypothetical protein